MNPRSLDLSLAEWLRRSLLALKGAALDANALITELRVALEDPGILDDSQHAGRPGAETRDALLALWIRSAVASVLANRSATSPIAAPGVVVLLEDEDLDARGAVRALRTRLDVALAATRAAPDEHGDEPELPLLVLAEEGAHQLLTRERAAVERLFPELATVDLRRSAPRRPAPVELLPIDRIPEGLRELADALALLGRAVDDLAPLEASDRPGFVDISGALLGERYRLECCIGTGGFGAVYEATDERFFGTRVAIKVLHPHVAADRERLAEFKNEARRVMRLDHPNIVNWRVFDETADGTHYFVMEFLDGRELQEVLEEEGKLTPDRAARVLLQLLDALRSAHHLSERESILHLDLKPKNVFLVPDDTVDGGERVKIIDFGVGQYVGGEDLQEDAGPPPPPTIDPWSPLSNPFLDSMFTMRRMGRASTAGTPAYASPEQAVRMLEEEGAPDLDGRSDLYSLGVMAFQMLSGRLPYVPGSDPRATLRRHVESEPVDLRKVAPQVPRRLAAFVMRCLRKERDERWADAREAYDALARIVRPALGRGALVAMSAAAVLVVASVAWALNAAGGNVAAAPLRDARSGQPIGRLYLDAREGARALVVRAGELGVDRGADLRVIDLDSGAPIKGVTAVAAAGGAVELRAAPIQVERLSVPRARLERAGGGAVTGEVELVLLGAGACAVEEVRFAASEQLDGSISLDEVGGRAVSVEETYLILRVRDPAAVRSLRVAEGDGEAVELRRVTTTEPEPAGWFAVELARVAAASDGIRETRLRASVVDVSETVRESAPIELELAGPLRLSTCELSGAERRGDLHYTTLRSAPSLALAIDEPGCRLRWTIDWSERGEERVALESDGWIELDVGSRLERPLPLEELELSAPYVYARLRFFLDAAARVWEVAPLPDGRELEPLQLYVTGARPRFALEVLAGERVLHGASDGERYPTDGHLRLRLVRIAGTPMRVELGLHRLGAGDSSEPVWSEEREAFQTFEGDEDLVSLELPGDGRYRLETAARFFDVLNGEAAGDPIEGERATLVLDRTPATVEARSRAAGDVLERDPAGDQLEVVLRDPPHPHGASSRTPAALRWRLERAAGGRREYRASGDAPGVLLPDEPRVVSLAELAEDAAALFERDGVYTLSFEGTDAAGNPVRGGTPVEWRVARTPPTVVLTTPAGLDWPSSGDGFEVRAEALDPNDLASVTLTVSAVDAPSELVLEDVALEREAPGSSAWSARVPAGERGFDYRWAGREVELELRARPTLGAPRVLTTRVRLPETETPPARIAWRHRGAPQATAAMRYVASNAETYAFGGRDDATEDDALRAAGMPELSDGLGRAECWRVEYAPGAIAGFYLDEREVTRAEFRAFVESAYDDARHWPAGWSPNGARGDALRRELAARDDALPVTGVTWGEASAFASWAGKRLPSLVQLEFAARGGARYRAYSCQGAAAPDSVHCGRAAPTRADRGADRTSDTGILHLGGNAAEWTATSYAGSPGTRLGDDARDNAATYLAPWQLTGEGRERYVYGGDWQRELSHFRRVRTRPAAPDAAWSGATVGFRCALLLPDVLTAVADPGASEFLPSEEVDR